MRRTPTLAVLAVVPVLAAAQESPLPKSDRKPALRLDPGEPAAAVTALAFAPDGKTLYAGGLDKLVRVYRLRAGGWKPDSPLRVPAGPGNAGAVNTLAVSDDGRWLAAAGRGPMRDEAGFAAGGVVVPADRRSDAMRRDLGVIYLFDLADPAAGRVLRGHRAEVRSLAFAAGTPTPVLVSSAVEGTAGVVRVWDAAAGVELASRADLPASPLVGRVAGWATGPGKTDLTVATAWPEPDAGTPGSLRLWDVARNRVEAKPDGALNIALAVVRDQAGKPAAVASAGFAPVAAGGKPQGRVVVRPVAGGAEPPAVGFPFTGTQHQIPVAVAPAGERLAVLLYRSPPAAGETDRPTDLVFLDRAGAASDRVALAGVSPDYFPLLAASPAGDVVAVAGFRDNRVELYPTTSPPGRPVVLPGGTPGYARVRFLDGGTAVGLTPDGGAGEFAFDFANRAVGAVAGRKPDAPAADGIEFTAVPPAAGGDRHAVRVTLPGRPAVTCRLIPGAVPTAYAYHPERRLIAVGHDEPRQAKSLITLFDTNGRELRQLTGHEGAVRSLAFSAARPLLASVAADGTACVWSLKDLDREPGAVDGLAVGERDGRVVVEAVPPALADRLAVGDRIEAAGGGAVATVAEFVWRAAAVPPGGTLPVTVRGRPAPVALPVVRGVDERKPLFTLWVDPGRADWVGWSPAGPYDASGEKAEARIGWLTNTGDPKAPALFAAAAEYRDANYRRQLLRFLAAEADLSAAADAWQDTAAPPPPRLTVSVPEKVGGVVRYGKATLRMALGNVRPDYPMGRAELKYRVRPPGAGEPGWASARPAAGEIDLSGMPWKRGRYAVEARLYGRPGGPVVDDGAEEFLAAPPAPTLAVTANGAAVGPDGVVVVMKPTVRIAATAAGYDGEPVAVTLDAGAVRELVGPLDLPLKPGTTEVRVRAVAANATADTREAETAEVRFVVRYDPPAREPAPAVGPVAFDPPGVATQFRGEDVIVVETPKVTAAARATAGHPLTAAGVALGDEKPVGDPAAVGKKEAVVRRELTLEAGKPARVTASAASENSDPGRRSAVVVYLPPVPEVAVAPLASAVVHAPKLTLSGTAAGPATILVRVASPANPGRTVEAKPDASGKWSAEVELFPGPNRITVTARTDWQERTLPGPIEVAYRRRPVIVTPVRDADAGATGVATVALTVESPAELPPIEVLIDGRPVRIDPPKTAGPVGERTRWEVAAPGVPVNTAAGRRDKLTVVVRNEDDASEPAEVTVKRAVPPPPPRPTVTVGAVPRDLPTEAATLVVPILVTSSGRVDRVEVWHRAGGAEEAVPVTVDPAVPAADGKTTVTARAEVRLAPGANRVRVAAVNAGGAGEDAFTVNRVVPPVLVEIEGIDESPRPGVPARPLARLPDAEPRFAPAASGLVAVRGTVRWADQSAPEAADPGLALAASVNAVEHVPIRLGPPENGVRRFHAPLFLNGDENTVRLEVRGGRAAARVPHAAAARGVVRVRCGEPLKRQRLHVVVFGVGGPPAAAPDLAAQVVRVLGGTPPAGRFEQGPFRAPGFEQAILYRPRVGEVQRGDILDALADVADRVRSLAADPTDGWVNDVVLVYYLGRDWVDERDGRRWLHTAGSLKYAAPAAWPHFAVAVDELPATAGVRLLLLNVVDPDGKAAPARDPGVPVFRYAWADPTAQPNLLPAVGHALATKVRLGEVIADTSEQHRKAPRAAGEPVIYLADEVRDRRIGRGGP